MDFVKRLQEFEDYMFLGGSTREEILNAESMLDLQFSEEYREYLGKCGMATANGHEFMGIGKASRLSVVENTQALRDKVIIPKDMYVIEKLAIDGIVVTQDKNGSVYQVYTDGEYTKIAETLYDYLVQ